jgi:predicted RNase H-like nuclease (RuvC/YqgF family)
VRFKFLEQRLREIELASNEKFAEIKKDHESMKQPLWDQLNRANRENESLQRELTREQDQIRKMLSQFTKMITNINTQNANEKRIRHKST